MDTRTLTEEVINAIKTRKPIPPIDAALSLDEAYQLQKEVTKALCPDGPGGIKAG